MFVLMVECSYIQRPVHSATGKNQCLCDTHQKIGGENQDAEQMGKLDSSAHSSYFLAFFFFSFIPFILFDLVTTLSFSGRRNGSLQLACVI